MARAPTALLLLLLAACGASDRSGDDTPARDAAEEGDLAGGDATDEDAEEPDDAPDSHDGFAGDDAIGDIEPADAGGDDDGTTADAEDAPSDLPPLLTPSEAIARVDPFIGTGGLGFGYASLSPAAQRPLGFAKVGPDTTDRGLHAEQMHFSGYNFADPHVRGFSHVRLVGTGATDLGCLRFLPLAASPSEPWRTFTALDKAGEMARPGYYSVRLPGEGVTAEMTAAMFSAVHRYTFDDGGVVVIDPGASITDDANTTVDAVADGATVTGSVWFRGGFTGRANGFHLYFDIALSEAPVSVATWSDGPVEPGTIARGSRAGLVLDFGDADTVELRVGLSLVDAAGARANREGELGGATFDDVADAALASWRERLARVRIAGGTERHQRMFYTALYNAYRMPTRLSELDGRYVGHDLEIHDAAGTYVSDLSLWDTYRTLHPWYSLTDHDTQRASLESLMLMAEQGGARVPRWPSMLGDTGSMIGSSADIVFGDAAAKGVEGIDWGRAFALLYDNAYGSRGGRDGAADYIALGYLPSDRHGSSVSRTLEYVWDDFGLAAVADAAGEATRAAELRARARGYMLLYDPRVGLFMPRTEAGFDAGVNPRSVYMGDGPFTEGSAWHWGFYFFHDPSAMLDVVGAEALAARLDTLFDASPLALPGRPSTTLPNSYYWHGNEPTIHAAYLFTEAGYPERTSYWVRQIQDRLYDDTPAGIPGNDDGGTMSAWLLFSAIGLYPVAGSDLYYLNAPLFDLVEVDLPSGGMLRVTADHPTMERYVVERVTVDGAEVPHAVRHAALDGATLAFTLSAP